MRYQGGKARIGKDLVHFMRAQHPQSSIFVDLFVGGGGVAVQAAKLFDRVIVNDLNPYIVAMYKDYQEGRVFPDKILKETHSYLKEHLDEDQGLSGFVGFGHSFSGIFFHTYASDKNYALATRNWLDKNAEAISKFELHSMDYRKMSIPENSIVYCDPPYEGTHPYKGGGLPPFSAADFWEHMRTLSVHNPVYISEEKAPADFTSVWQKQKRRSLGNNHNKPQPIRTENLFALRG